MSYILDALRRADAERERDPARGIHAQPAAVLPSGGGRGIPRWTWSVGAGALAIAAAAAWWTAQRPAPRVPAVVGLVTAQPNAPVPAAVQPPALPVAATVQPAVVPVAAAVSPPAPAPLPVVSEKPAARPVAVAAVPAKAAPAAVATPATAAPAATPAAVAAAAPATAAAPAAAVAAPTPSVDRILAVGELPPDVQRELPKLAISGGVHSENASQRLLIVGGQVMTEGAEVAPGVTLEQIRARTAVLRYRGYKYSVPF